VSMNYDSLDNYITILLEYNDCKYVNLINVFVFQVTDLGDTAL